MQLIQEKMKQLREEQPEKILENLPEPNFTSSSMVEEPEQPEVKMAQPVQQDELAPKQDTMQSFLADLESPAISPSEPPEPTQQESFSLPTAQPVSFEPAPEPNAAIPTAADKGAEPLSFEPPSPPQIPEPTATTTPAVEKSFELPVSTGAPKAESIEPVEPAVSGRQEFSLPQTNPAPPLDKPDTPPRESPFPAEQAPTTAQQPVEMPVSTKAPSVSSAADILGGVKSSSGFADAMGLQDKKAPDVVKKTQEEYFDRKHKEASGEKPIDRRDKALNSKPNVPREAMSPDMLERWKRIQAQQQPNNDSRIHGSQVPNATPGGNRSDVHTAQSMLASEAEMAMAQSGQILERIARGMKALAVQLREANRILDEGGF